MIHFLLSAVVFAVDQYCKIRVEEKPDFPDKPILGGRVTLTRYHNTGAFLNILEKKPGLVRTLTTVLCGLLLVLSGLCFRSDRSEGIKLGFSLLSGGAVSNLWDRHRRGYVVDYFSFKWLPKVVFNLGDLALFLGAALMLSGGAPEAERISEE